MSDNTKQIIVVRSDLQMRRGKEDSQAAHAAMQFLRRRIAAAHAKGVDVAQLLDLTPDMMQWILGHVAKITTSVDSEEGLLSLEDRATAVGLECHRVTDLGRTEFKGIPTLTAIAIGPDLVEKIDPVTRHLKLR